jgi:predicted metal-dependent hydrolase
MTLKKPANSMLSSKAFKNEVQHWAGKIGVQPKEVHVRSDMTRKWGSCSTRGRLSFTKDLLNEPDDKRKEIIIHELLHLKYPNHGRMFKASLEAYIGRG